MLQGKVECRSHVPGPDPPMPHKHNADRRHHIPGRWRSRCGTGRNMRRDCEAARQPDLDRGRGTGPLADIWTGWPCSIQGCRHPDHADGSHGVQAGIAPDGRSDGVDHYWLMDLTISAPDHSTMSRRAVTLPVVQPSPVPHGPLRLLIDSTEACRSAARVNGWRRNTGRSRAGSGVSCIWRLMPTTA